MSDSSDWDGLNGEQVRAHALKHGFVLDDTLVNLPICGPMTEEDALPWEDVDASRRNPRLQRKHPMGGSKQKYLKSASGCPNCQTPPDKLTWFYFESPKHTWPNECGLAGWVVVCDGCHQQVSFFLEAMS